MDGREVLLEEGLAERRGVQPHVVEAVLLHLEVDRARDDVARRQLGPRIVRRHEPPALGHARSGDRQLQQRALAAQRLGDEEAALLRVVQAGRVELDELHVADAAAGTPCHRDAVAGGGVGVAGVAVDLADAAGGQHHRGGGQRLDARSIDVERIDAVAARRLVAPQMTRRDQVDRHPALAQRDVRVLARLCQQRVVDRLAGGVGRVGDAPHRVAAFARQVQARAALRGRARTARPGSPANRRPAALRSAMKRAVCSSTRPAPASRVSLHMDLDAVVLAQHADDAALRPGRGAFVEAALGEHDYRHAVGQVQRDGEAGKAGPDDDDRRRQQRFRRMMARILAAKIRHAKRCASPRTLSRIEGLQPMPKPIHDMASWDASSQAVSSSVPADTWQATRALAPMATQILRDKDDYLADAVRDIGRRIDDRQHELFVSCDPAEALQQQFERAQPGVHRRSRHRHHVVAPALAGIAAALRTHGAKARHPPPGSRHGAGDDRVRRVPTARAAARCGSTPPRSMPTRIRVENWRACCWPSAGSAW